MTDTTREALARLISTVQVTRRESGTLCSYSPEELVDAAVSLITQHGPALLALAADGERYRHVIARGKLPTRTPLGYHYDDGVSYKTPDECIDTARQGAARGEGVGDAD